MIGSSQKKMARDAKEYSPLESIQFTKFKFNEPHQLRFIEYIGKVRATWYPTLGQNEDGSPKTSWRRILRPRLEIRTVLDRLEEAELRAFKRFNPNADTKSFNSQFAMQQKFMFIGFDRSEKKPVVKRLEAPYAVYNYLYTIGNEVSPEDRMKLLSGPYWFYDVIVTAVEKDVKRGVPAYFARSYSCKTYGNKWEGKVPISALDDGTEAFKKATDYDYLLEKGVYTAEEIDAIKDFYANNNVPDEIAPMSPEEIEEEIFINNPILLNAQKEGGAPVFPYVGYLIEEFKKSALPYDDSKVGITMKKNEQPPPENKEKPLPSSDIDEAPPLKEVSTSTTNFDGKEFTTKTAEF